MNRFILKSTFIKIYIYHFSINIFIEIRSQIYALETASLFKTTSFTNLEGVSLDLSRSFLTGSVMYYFVSIRKLFLVSF
jgi:hypothetical protein